LLEKYHGFSEDEMMVDMKNTYKILVWKHEGMWPLGKPRCKWEDGVRMILPE